MATTKASDFLDVMRGKQLDLESQMNDAQSKRVRDNRVKLESINKTILFCGHQNIAL